MGKVLFLKNLTHTNIIEAPDTGPELLSDATITALANKGVTAQAGVSTTENLPNLINSIELGTQVQTKTGTVTLSGTYGTATVNCGFKPDLVTLVMGGTISIDGWGTFEYNNTADFLHQTSSYPIDALSAIEYGGTIYENHTIISRTSNGFKIDGSFFMSTSDGSYQMATGAKVNYVAIKYT